MKKWSIFFLVLWVFLLIIPVIYGIVQNNQEITFSGLFYNPIDGYSYFAKMIQGKSGNWTFQLPYSPVKNGDIFIFTLYIFFGHLSRIFYLGIPVLYHLFRILFAILFFFSLRTLLKLFFTEENKYYQGAMLSILFGAGLGWIFVISGELPADFWLAEAYGFLSAFSNPHFILSLVIMNVLIVILLNNEKKSYVFLFIFLLSIILVSISPFAGIVIGFIYFVYLLINFPIIDRNFKKLISLAIPVIFIGYYQMKTITSDPVLSLWNAQNITASPSILNLIFSFSPAILGIVMLLVWVFKKKIKLEKNIILLLLWIVFAFAMTIIPFNLQRRFLVGIYIPLVIVFWYLLGVFFENRKQKLAKFWIYLLIGIVIPSNLIVFLGSMNAIRNYEPLFFTKNNYLQAARWMDNNIKEQAVVLTNQELGLLVPAYGNFKVVYGHPFESINEDVVKNNLNKFWNDTLSVDESQKFLIENHVNYILCEKGNPIPNCPTITKTFTALYDYDGIEIFQVKN